MIRQRSVLYVLYKKFHEEEEKMEKTVLRREILRLLGENGRLQAADIAERINAGAAEVENEIHILEKDNIIIGYRAIFDESQIEENAVKAVNL